MTEDDFKKHFRFKAGFKALDRIWEESFEAQMRRSITEIRRRAEMHLINQSTIADELDRALTAVLSGVLK